MKLMRVGAPGAEKPAIVGPDSLTRDLSGIIRDFDADALSPEGLARLAAIDPSSLPLVAPVQRIGPPVPRPVNFIGIGLNYADHAAEAGQPIPNEPIIFLKSSGSYCGPNDDVHLPRGAKKTDWEVELGVVIGTRARSAQAASSSRECAQGRLFARMPASPAARTARGSGDQAAASR